MLLCTRAGLEGGARGRMWAEPRSGREVGWLSFLFSKASPPRRSRPLPSFTHSRLRHQPPAPPPPLPCPPPTKVVRLLYEIHSCSSVSATASRFSIFLMRFRPNDRILRFSMPDRPPIFSIEFVDRAKWLRAVSGGRWGGEVRIGHGA